MLDNDELKSNKKISNDYLKYIIVVIIVVLLIILIKILFFKKNNFYLVGSDMVLKYNEEYQEPGYSYIDNNGNNFTDYVTVTNNVDIKVPGVYEIIYTYKNDVLKRKVTVLEPDSYKLSIDYKLNTNDYTNEDIIINYKVKGETFERIELPNQQKSTKNEGNFTVNENGTYKLVAYNVKDELFEKEIIVNNIDKEKPNGTCQATLKNDKTEITVDAKDNNKISKYEYLDDGKIINTSISSNYNTTTNTSKNISIKVYDEAGNYNSIICEVIDKSFHEPILPASGEDVIFQGETETLKAYIIKKSGYFLTRVWVKDAYTQLNKATSPDYGKNLYKPIDLLKKEMTKENLENKLVIGFNASGFYLKDTFDARSVSIYPSYDRTSVGTIVINNGVLVRNAYNYAVKQWYLTGITKDNKMVVFEDNVAKTETDKIAKQAWAQTVIDSGIRNTFSFAGPVILNGQELTSFSSSMPDKNNGTVKNLQLICQINENNYALYTSSGTNRKNAISVFLALGCQTAVNLDGGGSIALLYKDRNSTEFKTVIGGGRQLPEAGYFTE
jgi:hypothetical protein